MLDLYQILATLLFSHFPFMSTSTFNPSNKEHLIYEQGFLQIAVLGGIRIDGLDRMRSTLKIQVEHLAIRHNLDLYNDTQVEKLVRKAAQKLEVGTSVIAAALQDLTNCLETYRLEELERSATASDLAYKMTEKEVRAAQAYLKAPNLIGRTSEDIGQSGVIGEIDNRLLMYLIFTTRKRSNPLHVVSLGSSGTGKTHLQEKVGQLIPEEDRLEITTLSENAFYYFGQQELKNKLILIEDLDGAESVLYPLRELQSKKQINKTVVHKNTKGETRSVHLKVEGPVCVAGCTTKEQIYEDNANRSFLLYLDESIQQDEQIMAYQRAVSAGKIDFDHQEQVAFLLRNCQRTLKPIKVVNPFAEALILPLEVLKPRRTNNHYLQFIEAVTFYHQFQREEKADENGEVFIETTLEDIQIANQLLKEVLLRKSDELSGACRNYFEALKVHLIKLEKNTFVNREIRSALRITGTTLRRYHNELLNTGQISIVKGKRHTGYTYQITDPQAWQQLKTNIDNVLDQMLEKIRKATKPVVSQSKNGSVKKLNTSKKSSVSQQIKKG